MALSDKAMGVLTSMQNNEYTEHFIYKKIASFVKSPSDRSVLESISQDELRHSRVWQNYTGKESVANKRRIFFYTLCARLLGYTFAIKLMEKGEDAAGELYGSISDEVPEAAQFSLDEQGHEEALIELLDEERLTYVGSMVLGLNDALVELTGTLAGLTFALRDTKLIALSGLITGISATLSMASSEYLSSKSEGRSDALKSCVYTGIAYCVTVALLVLPYLCFSSANYGWALGTMLLIVIGIISFFSYYISVAKGLSFKSRFTEMASISIGVALISFVIGLLVKRFLGIDV